MNDRVDIAMQLLTGIGGTSEPDRGAALLTAAAEEGDSGAAAMMATIEAIGAGRPQSWDKAFAWLRRAADLGSTSARAQLALLERGTGAIDLPALITPPPKRSLCDAPRIRAIDGFATPAECDWLMNRARGDLGPAMVLDIRSGRATTHPDRTNKSFEFYLAEMDVVVQILRARIAAATNLPVPVFESAQVMQYSVGEEFRPHYDFLTGEGPGWAAEMQRLGQRIATFLLFLNDDFEGGETEFPKIGISHRGRRGDALFWANVDPAGEADPQTMHAGLPPTRGEKWILSQWIRDRTPAPE